MAIRIHFSALIMILSVVAGRFVSPAQAEEDKIAGQLLAARKTYETTMQGIRVDVEKGIARKLDQATKGGVDDKAVDRIREEKKAYQAEGKWPDVQNLTEYKNRAAKAAKVMIDAYNTAVAAYAKANKDALADGVTAERKMFEAQSDIVPWREVLAKDAPAPSRTISATGSPLIVDPGIAGSYRIEISARRSEGNGALTVELPVSDGKFLIAAVPADSKSQFHLLLDVVGGKFSIAMGLPRDTELKVTEKSAKPGIQLSATAGGIVVESLRVKPVIDGAPEELVVKDTSSPRQTVSRQREDPYVQGKSWRGQAEDGGLRSIRLAHRSGNRVVFHVDGAFAGAVWKIAGNLNNGIVYVDDIDRIQNPAGHPAVRTKDPTGQVRINNDGTLDMDASVRGSSGNVQNWSAKFQFTGARPN